MDFKILLLSKLLFGCLTAIMARSRGRSPWVWFIVGMMLTWLGLLVLLILPSNEQKTPAEEEVPLVPEILVVKTEWDGTIDWFYLDQYKVVQGPLTVASLKELWINKKISPGTWVWNEKIAEWKKLDQAKDVLQWLQK